MEDSENRFENVQISFVLAFGFVPSTAAEPQNRFFRVPATISFVNVRDKLVSLFSEAA